MGNKVNDNFCFVIKNGKKRTKYDSCSTANIEFFKEENNTAQLLLIAWWQEMVIFDNKLT